MADITIGVTNTHDTLVAADEKTLKGVSFKRNVARKVKVFDLGNLQFLMDELFSGYMLPNYMTDWGKDLRRWTITGTLLEGVDGDDINALEAAVWVLEEFFVKTCFSYKYNFVKFGTDIQYDYKVGATYPIYVRVESFDWDVDMEAQGSLTYTLKLIQGEIVRIIQDND